MSKAGLRAKRTRWNACNIVAWGQQQRHLWQFSLGSSAATPVAERVLTDHQPLPPKFGSKDWRHLIQPKLNVAWLPADQVFLRVAEFPKCDLNELLSMVELQLEKLSPMPVNQIVWSVEPLPVEGGELQNVIVLIAARNLVEEYLGGLEGQGYLADRLEVPWLHQLTATQPSGDGTWIYLYPQADKTLCLVAWWVGGKLRSLNLLSLPNTAEAVKRLEDQLTQIAWAAEVEGWLSARPDWHIVAEPKTAGEWQAHLGQWAGSPVHVHPAPPMRELAALNAHRTARGEAQANLLPIEHATRYRQQYVDGLWMRGLGSVVAIYLVGVLVYLTALEVLKFQLNNLKNQIAALESSYTTARQLKARMEVVQEQIDLKYAALDCWHASVERLPEGVTLTWLMFQRGQKLTLYGTAPAEQPGKVTDYFEALGKVSLQGTNGPPLFSKVDPPQIQGALPNQPIKWNFTATLSRKEVQ